ncbi:hypothetical protein BDZ88DRAFT_472690 [Geranomyces variabilis]|nr:hypothetical protein BDZ88DRAFT_472690 [Geranomyces variabilis]KAJ3132976.1 hypothetical protein HDU90_006512 [Geranomyces variabilis]
MLLPSRREGVLQLICLLWVLGTLSLTTASPAAQSPAFFPRNVNHTTKATSDDNRELAFAIPLPTVLQGLDCVAFPTYLTRAPRPRSDSETTASIPSRLGAGYGNAYGPRVGKRSDRYRVLRVDIDQRGATQSKTSFLSPLTAALAAIQSPNTATVVETFTLASLLPVLSASANWVYTGSPTTSPCSENVLWFTLSTSVQISIVEFVEFRKVIGHHDASAGDLVTGGITVVEMEPATTSLQMNNLVAGGIAVVELNPAAASGSQSVQPPPSSSRWFFPTNGLPFLRHG